MAGRARRRCGGCGRAGHAAPAGPDDRDRVLALHLLTKAADGLYVSPIAGVAVAAMFVVPFRYAVPAGRRLALRHRWWLLTAQAVLTYLPFVYFGPTWIVGTSGLLAGLMLLMLSVGWRGSGSAPFGWSRRPSGSVCSG